MTVAAASEPPAAPHPSVAVSIISHGHGPMVLELVQQLAQRAEPCVQRVIVTLNTPEPELEAQLHGLEHPPFTLEIVCNRAPKGFGSNHNAAFAQLPAHDMPSHVCLLNPDVSLLDDAPMAALTAALADARAGMAYPRVLGKDGQVQDNERSLVTPLSLVRRRLLGRVESRIDWVSGACMALRTPDWQRLGGFDERFHMYCEDVDLSLRVRRDVGLLVRADTTMGHQAQRASSRKLSHLFWHVRSLLLLWSRPSFHWARRHPSPFMRDFMRD